MFDNFMYITGVITDGFSLCEDLRHYLQKSIKAGKVTLRVSQAANRVFVDSPKFKSIDAHYVCLSWNSEESKINFMWRNDEGKVKTFDTLLKLVEDIEKSVEP